MSEKAERWPELKEMLRALEGNSIADDSLAVIEELESALDDAIAERDQRCTITPEEAHELFSMWLAYGMRPPEIDPSHPLVTGAEKLGLFQSDDRDE